MQQLLTAQLATALSKLDLKIGEPIKLEHPAEAEYGDWATNIALILAPTAQMNPRTLAEKIVTELEQAPEIKQDVAQVSVAGPGFINFKLKTSYYQNSLKQKLQWPVVESPQRILIEYGQPNTHKLPHIGHLFSYIAGDALARILAKVGHTVRKINYQGDVGLHVAKCLYAWQQSGCKEPSELVDKVKLLQECYQLGSKLYEEDEGAKAAIIALNKDIYNPTSAIQLDWQKTRQWSLDYYLQFEQELGITQDQHYLESQVWEKGLDLVKSNIGKVFSTSEGAVVFPGEQYGLHTRVFITKHGTPTYECKDMGLNTTKYEDWQFDQAIITTANEQNAYFAVIFKALGLVNPELEGKFKHLGFGLISLSSGKMSSRTGQILSATDLLNVVKKRVGEIVGQREGLSTSEQTDITHKVALAAIKYAFLKGNILQNMSFDLEESIAFEGNSGPYLQYTYARIKSIIAKAVSDFTDFNPQLLTAPEEITLLQWLTRGNETVTAAANNSSPHLIATYLFELAQRFNSFYKVHSINNAATNELKLARLALANRVAIQLQEGLALLGIEVVEKM